MSVVKKQHYVPQGYLRRFANIRGQFYVFDKYTRRSFVSSVHDVANGNYFYDFGSDVVEEIVANIDAHPELGITQEQRQRLVTIQESWKACQSQPKRIQ